MEFLILIALVALLFMVGGLRGRLNALDATLRMLEERLSNFDALPAPPRAEAVGIPAAIPVLDPEPQAPPPVETPPAQPAQIRREQISEPPPPPKEEPKPWGPAPQPEPVAPAGGGEEPPPAPPRDYGDFEHRFGTQWVVWVGGLALALGGIFLVRYSIEAGLFGPGVRIVARRAARAGADRRRRMGAPAARIVAGICAHATAHIPSILTAAGTTVAYADVYAAYALYDFLAPGFAFILLGVVALATLAAALLHGPALAGLGLVGAYVTPLLVASTAAELLVALHLSRGRDRRGLRARAHPAVALARDHRGRASARSGCLPGLDAARAMRSARTRSIAVAGFALAAMLIVSGFCIGPQAEPGTHRRRLVCGVLAPISRRAACWCWRAGTIRRARDAFAAARVATVAIAWRAEAAAAACRSPHCSPRW